MAARKSFFPALALTAVIAAGIGFGATHFWDNRAIQKLTAERDEARDCRRSGTTVAPCPVAYRGTRIEWRDRIRTVETPDPKKSARIAVLSAELVRAHRAIAGLERRKMRQRVASAYGWQNGTRQYPYNTDERCPTGSVVVYDPGLSATGAARRHSGDPGVCYVLTKLHRVALYSPGR
ncbi:MAG TPA: hypothetical protein VKR31_15725 [Rhizomicrobium sp.]|nr:hypothetical protein [Rhizomicrobium sp.]